MMKQNKKKALFIARKVFSELVFDIQKLEGMPFTMPEVQTYIQGITVGGHKITDEEKLKQQILGWEKIITFVSTDTFSLSKEIACSIQAIIAKDEVLEIGQFRSGQVGIAGTEYTPPRAETLDKNFSEMLIHIKKLHDICEQAYRLHLDFARNQFFYDGNKRTGLLMLNGHVMSYGFPPLSIPAKRQIEYNEKMIRFYENGDYAEMLVFLKECHHAMYDRFE
ncbi:Fic family protein [Desulfovibrio inopinatus]|uniref:Fic family protein n=1 Tax=Desulfovibrio inopinatus TaxID=102109 RepID=UPI001FE20535|nr:Fic family protein [Desulfovibrio inopinatus]